MRWQVGEVCVTTVIEQPLHALEVVIADATPENVKQIGWLVPDFADADGAMHGLIQAFIIQAPGSTIVVDTCVGDDKARLCVEAWNRSQTGFLARFREAGFDPADIDVVLCTHLHVDHVGWNTRWDGSAWLPTFPNARYLFAEVELAYWQGLREQEPVDPGTLADPLEALLAAFQADQRQTHVDSIKPILDAGLADIVRTDHRLCKEVALVPTPGHTPGHVSVMIQSGSDAALITGDCIHHPCQMARPGWTTRIDSDAAAGIATRMQLLQRLAGTTTLLMGSHFAEPTAGRVVADGDGFRLTHAEA